MSSFLNQPKNVWALIGLLVLYVVLEMQMNYDMATYIYSYLGSILGLALVGYLFMKYHYLLGILACILLLLLFQDARRILGALVESDYTKREQKRYVQFEDELNAPPTLEEQQVSKFARSPTEVATAWNVAKNTRDCEERNGNKNPAVVTR